MKLHDMIVKLTAKGYGVSFRPRMKRSGGLDCLIVNLTKFIPNDGSGQPSDHQVVDTFYVSRFELTTVSPNIDYVEMLLCQAVQRLAGDRLYG